MKMSIIIIIVFVFAIAGLYFWRYNTLSAPRALSIADKVEYSIEIRDEPLGMARGLSGRESLEEDAGMLFVYSRPERPLFWMKDMNFRLDFVWIREFKIVELSENIPHPAENDGKTYRLRPSEPADMVLEINAGDIEKHQIKVGGEIKISN